MRATLPSVVLLASLPLMSCGGSGLQSTGVETPLNTVATTETWSVDGLSKPVTVVWTEGAVPHVYAHNRKDLRRVQGFLVARDRFFQMDLVRRLSTGRLSELLGDIMLEADLESRGIAMTYGTDVLLNNLSEQQRDEYTAYAEGFNDYIAAVQRGELPPPSEYDMASPLLGVTDPSELLVPWTLRDVASIGGTILYRLGYETGDVGRADQYLKLETLSTDVDEFTLRQDYAYEIWDDVRPVYDLPSAAGVGTQGSGGAPAAAASGSASAVPPIEAGLLSRMAAKGDRIQQRFGRDHEEGWGSNAWAVAGDFTTDGRALMAGDGHLELDIPALMYQIGLDTAHLGGGDLAQKGLLLVGMPMLSVGTNGSVAWSTTQHSGDITDWYSEVITLDADGLPAQAMFQGQFRPLVRHDEVVEIAGVVPLGSVERTEVWPRWTTEDGRWIAEVEGEVVSGPDADVAAGTSIINASGTWIVPQDMNNDGVVSAISFDFTGLDRANLFQQFEDFGTAANVAEFHEATRMGQALSQNMVAADTNGDVYYAGYEMVPCRGYLPRDASGRWLDGANPTMLLDGTTYGGFTIPVGDDFAAIEGDPDPYRCVIPFADYPKSFTPDVGYLLTANQDPGGLESSGSLWDDPIYIGGPWDDGYRAEAIDRLLSEHIAAGTADLDAMQAIQGHHESALGRRHLGEFLAAIERAQDLTSPDPGSADERLRALYDLAPSQMDEVHGRLSAWAAAGQPALSGVETFYHPSVTAEERDHAVATMIFNVWFGDAINRILNDEGLPSGVWKGGSSAGKLRVLHRMFEGRGPDNPEGSAGWNPATEESIFFDDRSTLGVIETSDEILLVALLDALAFLESPPDSNGGGFGTSDMDAWLWGMRHQAEFGSLVGAYVDDPLLTGIFNQFAINTDRLPLLEDLPVGDTRRALEWFPRPGDNRAIDAANPGLSGRQFRHGSGPVMRMVWSLGPDGVSGRNVIPGGQSGLVDSEHYDDQVQKWLANETFEVPITPEEVAAAAIGRADFVPVLQVRPFVE